MKYRIGFVTNSSSYSSLVVHHIESETLDKIFKKQGLDISLLWNEDFMNYSSSDVNFLYASVSQTLKSLLEVICEDEFEDYEDDEEIEIADNNSDDKIITIAVGKIRKILRDIKKYSTDIDNDTSCYIQASTVSDEADVIESYLKNGLSDDDIEHFWMISDDCIKIEHTNTLDIHNGKGRFIQDYIIQSDDENKDRIKEFIKDQVVSPVIFNGYTFVVTGKLNNFKREDIKEQIECCGGKVTDSITKDTSYLITDFPDSDTTKVKKAKELNIPIISENDYIVMFNDLSKDIDLNTEYIQVAKC